MRNKTVALLVGLCAYPQLPAVAQQKLDLEGLQISAGASQDFLGKRLTSEFHKIVFRGNTLSKKGDPTKNVDITNQFSSDSEPGKTNDTPDLKLDLVQGSGVANNGFLSILGVNKFKIPKLDLRPVRTVAQLSSSLDSKQINLAYGLEAPPMHLSAIGVPSGVNVANWLTLGFSGEQQWAPYGGSGKNQSVGLATYRAFLGKAIGWKPRTYVKLSFDSSDVLKAVPDYSTFKSKTDAIRTSGKTPMPASLEGFIFFESTLIQDPTHVVDVGYTYDLTKLADYTKFIVDQYKHYSDAYRSQPSSAIWVESVGWYTAVGDPLGRRFKHLLAVTLTLWGDLSKTNRSQVQLRYENGYQRATPGIREERLMASVGLSF